MTNREFYTNIANGVITEAEIAHASAAIAKLDATNEARKNKTSPKDAEKAAADAAIREQIFALITAEPQTASELGAQMPPVVIMQFVRMVMGIGVFPAVILYATKNEGDVVVEKTETGEKKKKTVSSLPVTAGALAFAGICGII